MATTTLEQLVHIPADDVHIEGMLELPENAAGIVLFAHGSGSSRHSPRNNYVARVLREAGIGTLLMDLLTREEDSDYETRFDIPLLTHRLLAATAWVENHADAAACRSAILAPAPAPLLRCRPPPHWAGKSPLSSRAAAAPIWPELTR